MDKSVLALYESAMLKKREAERLIESLKVHAMDEVRASGSVDNDKGRIRYGGNAGSFIITKYITYTYSPAVDRAIMELRLLKEKEIRENIATATESEMFMFKQK